MALHRGIQSAVFYYLSCAPCFEARYRRDRKQEADLLRAKEKETILRPDGTQYQTPVAPSTTNPGWNLEIALGPSKVSKAAAKRLKKDTQCEPTPRDSGSTGASEKLITSANLLPWDDPRINTALTHQRPSPRSNPNAARGQENESFASTTAGSTAAMNLQSLVPAKLATKFRSKAQPTPPPIPQWLTYANPPINDLHPATVTKYTSAADVAWMFEPPPPAKVMMALEPERPSRYTPRTVKPRLTPSQELPRQLTDGALSDEQHNQVESDVDEMFSPGDVRGKTRPSPTASLRIRGRTGDEDNAIDDYTEHAILSSDENIPATAVAATISTSATATKKRDQAYPLVAVEGLEPFVFPQRPRQSKQPKEDRRDSGTTVDVDEDDWSVATPGGMVEGNGGLKSGPRRRPAERPDHIRWRWSIDW